MNRNSEHDIADRSGAASGSAARSRASLLWAAQYRFAPYAFVFPFVALFGLFFLYPLLRSVPLSLQTTSGPGLMRYVGTSHYRFLLTDWLFWLAVANTLVYAIGFLLLQVPLSLGLALLLNSPRVRFRNAFRLAFFSSNLIGQVFVAMIFSLLLAPRYGLVNRAFGWLLPNGVETNWRGDPRYAMPALVLATLWLTVGYGMVYFLAALQAVDQELYEASQVDGAGAWSQFWHITLPGIRPVGVFLILVGTIAALSLFELPFVFFQGAGPRFAGFTIVEYLYAQGFEAGDLGMAAAVGWVLVALILIVALVQIKVSGAGRDTA